MKKDIGDILIICWFFGGRDNIIEVIMILNFVDENYDK